MFHRKLKRSHRISVMPTVSQVSAITVESSATPQSIPPIARCPEDVLYNIFSVNGDTNRSFYVAAVHETSPISITRRTSQVCKEWRQLILGSPSLWGKLLDLNDLNPGSDRWRNEVLRRTKQAMLHVRVDLDPTHPAATSLLFQILDKKWSRIRNLEVSIFRPGYYDDKRWLAIYRPTENLRTIFLHFQSHTPEPLRSNNNILFSGQAPSLKFATVRYMNFQLPAQWLSRLFVLRIAGNYQVSQLIESMSFMPFLEYVELYDLRSDNTELLRTITFPRLKRLIIRGQFAACIAALSHITIPPGCGLQLIKPDRREHISHADLITFSQVLPRYCETYFNVHIPTSVKLSIQRNSFTFQNISADIDIPLFSMRVEKSSAFSSMNMLFKAFLGCPFSKVTKLSFDCDPDATFLSSDSDFSSFLSLFVSLDRLTTKPAGLQPLSRISTHNDGVLLPTLKTICLFWITRESPSQITDFLHWRRSSGAPIQVLMLSSQSSLKSEGVNLNTLEQISGLKVVWGSKNPHTPDSEYLCGSGEPQQLDFRDTAMHGTS